MLKQELNEVAKFSGKGILNDVTEDGLLIYDEKNEVEELFNFEDLKILIGKPINFNFTCTEKK